MVFDKTIFADNLRKCRSSILVNEAFILGKRIYDMEAFVSYADSKGIESANVIAMKQSLFEFREMMFLVSNEIDKRMPIEDKVKV